MVSPIIFQLCNRNPPLPMFLQFSTKTIIKVQCWTGEFIFHLSENYCNLNQKGSKRREKPLSNWPANVASVLFHHRRPTQMWLVARYCQSVRVSYINPVGFQSDLNQMGSGLHEINLFAQLEYTYCFSLNIFIIQCH